jgi:hypothetical protein
MASHRRWPIVLGVLAVVAAGCSSSESDRRGDELSAEESAYLEEVRDAEDLREEVHGSIREALERSYRTRDTLLALLREQRPGSALMATLSAARQIQPPPRFEEDHASWIASLRESVRLAGDAEEAALRGDLVGVSIALMHSTVDLARRVAAWSEPFCRVVVGRAAGGPSVLCVPDESVPGEEYGARVHGLLKRFSLELRPRVSGFPADFAAEELFAYLTTVQPEVEDLIERTRNEMLGLDPPEELRPDHEVLLRYFEDTLDVAVRITRAAQEGNLPALQVLFGESSHTLERTQQQLSDEARPIVAVYFFPSGVFFPRQNE